jgi:hypothetical protein
MDHILVDVDPDVQDTYAGSVTGPSGGLSRGITIPIEAKVRSISVRLLYEVCRLQKFSFQDLRQHSTSLYYHSKLKFFCRTFPGLFPRPFV